MINMELNRVIALLDAKVCHGDINKYGNRKISGIFYDSRKAAEDSIFVPIVGEKVDAHRFIPQVFETGCFVSFTEEEDVLMGYDTDKILIKVENNVAAAQKLAKEYRLSLEIPIVGITGSVGKTTTREMIALALSAQKKVYATPGNKNSQIGTPDTVLSTDEDAEICVLEMGMSMPGEMSVLADIVRPNVAVFTNIGVTHIENLGSREAILEEKLHITDYMPDYIANNKSDSSLDNRLDSNSDNVLDNDLVNGSSYRKVKKPVGGVVFVNNDNDMLSNLKLRDGLHKCTYGLSDNSDVYAQDIDTSEGYPRFTAVVNGEKVSVKLNTYGTFQIYNALAGLAVASHFGIDLEKAAGKLSEYKGFSHRNQIFNNKWITVIDDTYNAAPDSMKAAIDMLSSIKCNGRRIAVLADMKELGAISKDAHIEIGEYAYNKGNIDILITYGPLSRYIESGFTDEENSCIHSTIHTEDTDELDDCLKNLIKPGDLVLFKGSNSMGLFNYIEKVLNYEFM